MVNVIETNEYRNGCKDIYLSSSEGSDMDFYCIKEVVGSEDGDWNVKVYKAFYDFIYGFRYGMNSIVDFHNGSESEQRRFVEFLLGHFNEMVLG